MDKVPIFLDKGWSPLLRKVANCTKATNAVADFIVGHFTPKGLMEEVRGLLVMHLAHITPSTVWLLQEEQFKEIKLQQHVRLKVSFCVHDRFENNVNNLINLA